MASGVGGTVTDVDVTALLNSFLLCRNWRGVRERAQKLYSHEICKAVSARAVSGSTNSHLHVRLLGFLCIHPEFPHLLTSRHPETKELVQQLTALLRTRDVILATEVVHTLHCMLDECADVAAPAVIRGFKRNSVLLLSKLLSRNEFDSGTRMTAVLLLQRLALRTLQCGQWWRVVDGFTAALPILESVLRQQAGQASQELRALCVFVFILVNRTTLPG